MVGVNFDFKRDVSDSRACEQIWKKNLEMCDFFLADIGFSVISNFF